MPASISIELLRRRAPFFFALIVACGLLAGCGSDKKNQAEATPTAAPTQTVEIPPTPLSGLPRLGAAVWATAVATGTNEPVGAATPTVNDTVLYAVFPIESLPAGTQLVGSWYFNNTSLDGLNSAMRVDKDQVAGWIEFHIERTDSDPWPDGVYELVITDGTTAIQQAEITIS